MKPQTIVVIIIVLLAAWVMLSTGLNIAQVGAETKKTEVETLQNTIEETKKP